MTEEKGWTPMKALGRANRAIEELMVPTFKADLSEDPHLEFSNLMNADSRALEQFLILYGGYKAYLESSVADVEAARDALKAAFDNGYQTAGHKIAEDREEEGRKKLTRDEVKGAILKAYPSLRELNRVLIEQEAVYTKMAGLLSAYTSAYNTVSRIVTLRTNGSSNV